ncbi:MAG: thiopurine S-methyltransferase [Rhodobiaceae bacterium]|nr:thiopurine S-methyltransferase [Rhodobiaceae bacterium]MCC0062256.1 thiopurine S-methyltransferase [Rhodobiaceae bacterium]
MDPSFWHERWSARQIGFHEGQPNAMLVKHFARLKLAAGSRIFVPLCGKSRDLGWLLEQGHSVAGVELSRIAVEELFEELGVSPAIENRGPLMLFSFEDLAVFVGDFFKLTADQLGSVDAVYDRAALVALPASMRPDYARHLASLSGSVPQLLISFDYDQSATNGPPFSVPGSEIEKHYGKAYRAELVESAAISGPLSQRCTGTEQAWLLSPA